MPVATSSLPWSQTVLLACLVVYATNIFAACEDTWPTGVISILADDFALETAAINEHMEQFTNALLHCLSQGYSFGALSIANPSVRNIGLCVDSQRVEFEAVGVWFGSGTFEIKRVCERIQDVCSWAFGSRSMETWSLTWPEAAQSNISALFEGSFWRTLVAVSEMQWLWACCPDLRANPHLLLERVMWARTNKQPPLDVGAHLSFFRTIASQPDVRSITEFGVQYGMSSAAFMLGMADQRLFSSSLSNLELHGYDLERYPDSGIMRIVGDSLGVKYQFHRASSLEVQIPDSDLLYVDSLHVYGQVIRELSLHVGRVRRFILLHDTALFGDRSQCGRRDHNSSRSGQFRRWYCKMKQESMSWSNWDMEKGIQHAIADFLKHHTAWSKVYESPLSNGLVLLERTSSRNKHLA